MAETSLCAANLILPIFVIAGDNCIKEIKTMPGVFTQSIDQVVLTVQKAAKLGIKAVALFPVIDEHLKSDDAEEAHNLDNLICQAIRSIKNAGLEIGIICDVALDPYTTHGHDGILIDGDVDNDQTIEALSNQALVLAKAGADIVAPSDMMDGRIMAIRKTLDQNGFTTVNILAYAAKYNSSFYQPFREVLGSQKKEYISKATYQLDIRNTKEALREIAQDIDEGADMILIKPGILYLDIIKDASQKHDIHILAFQVSGEYAMMKFAAQNNALDWQKSIIESLICLRRAGASAIFTYAALEVAELLNK
jgi:porphobilinogen synthase